MKQGRLMRLADRNRPLVFLAILILFCNGLHAQINPALGTVSNKSYSPAQSIPTDFRSQFWDNANFVARDFQSTAEAIAYINLSKYRGGHFPVFVHLGGVLQSNGSWLGGTTIVYWWKTDTSDGSLVRWYTDSTASSGGTIDSIAANSGSGFTWTITNPKGPTTNLGLSLAFGGDATGTVGALTVNSIQGKNLAYITNYLNLSNTPAIPPQLNLTSLGLITQSGSYPNLVITGQTPSFEQTLLKLNTTSQLDSINIGANIFRIFGTSALGIPSGTTAQRPGSPIVADTRWNTDSAAIETWNGSAWVHPTGGGGGGGGGITALTGDATASGTGSVPITFATVNSNVFASNTFLKFTVNAKGLVTAAVVVGSSDITGALGFTPYNATNPSGFIPLTALSATAPLAYNNSTGVFSIPAAATAQNGYLTSTDWNTFNGKLTSALTNGNIFVGNGSNVATGVTPSGDWTMTNAGVSTIANNAITTVKIINNAVTYAKLQATSGQALLGSQAAGPVTEITLGTNLSMTGGVLNASTAGAQTLTYTQNATNNNLAISGGNSQNFLPATTNLAGLLDTARARYVDSAKGRLITFGLFTHNGLGATGGDSIQLGLNPFDQNTTLNTAGFDFLITNLPNKTVGAGDSAVIENSAGKLFKALFPVGGINQLTGDVTAGPGTGPQVATISALAVTTGKIAANAVTFSKMATGPSGQLTGYDGSGNFTNITLGTGLSMSGTTLNAASVALTRQTINSGTNQTVSAPNTLVTINFSAAVSVDTITMPTSPADQNTVEFEAGGTIPSGQEIMTLLLKPNTSQSIIGAVTLVSFNVGEYAKFKWNNTLTAWMREN